MCGLWHFGLGLLAQQRRCLDVSVRKDVLKLKLVAWVAVLAYVHFAVVCVVHVFFQLFQFLNFLSELINFILGDFHPHDLLTSLKIWFLAPILKIQFKIIMVHLIISIYGVKLG